MFESAKKLKDELRAAFSNTIYVDNSSPVYNPEHVNDMASTVYGESTNNPDEMKAMIDTVLNRRNQLGLNIQEVLTQKDKQGRPMYQAYGGQEYQKYKNNKLTGYGEPEKKATLDNLIQQLQSRRWTRSDYTNFDKAPRPGAVKIGAHYFWKEFQGNRKK